MVYSRKRRFRSKSKRRFKRRRRFRKRYRGPSKRLRFKAFVSNQARMNGSRKYLKEEYGTKFTANEGTTAYRVWCWQNSYSKLKAIVDSTLGDSGIPLGGNVVDESKLQYKYYLKDLKTVTHVRNISTHPVFLSMYTMVSKRDRGQDVTYNNPAKQLIQDLKASIEDDAGTGTTDGPPIINYTGEQIVTNTTSVQLDTVAHHIKMRNQRKLMTNWRIKQYKLFKLNPGDDVFWTMSRKGMVFNPATWIDDVGDNIETKKGVTEVVLMKLTGVIGESVSTAGNCAQMKADCAISCIISGSVIPLNTNSHERSYAVSVASGGIKTDYEAPTEHAHAADE